MAWQDGLLQAIVSFQHENSVKLIYCKEKSIFLTMYITQIFVIRTVGFCFDFMGGLGLYFFYWPWLEYFFVKLSRVQSSSVVTEPRLELESDWSTVVLENLQTRSNSLEAFSGENSGKFELEKHM